MISFVTIPPLRHEILLNHPVQTIFGRAGKRNTILVMNIARQPYMKNNFKIVLSLLILVLSAGCTVHRVDIQQGNIVSQEMMSQLKIGMHRDEIIHLMGKPMIIDPFRKNRWDYVHTFKSGKSGEPRSQYRVTLIFDGERLNSIDSNTPLEELPAR